MQEQTTIYKLSSYGERKIGAILASGDIIGASGQEPNIVGRSENGKIFRRTAHDERELGFVDEQGYIHSHGLFEGGVLGWVESDGTVVQAGLILGEEEVGRVEGSQSAQAGAALLLLFLPDDAEEEKRMQRR